MTEPGASSLNSNNDVETLESILRSCIRGHPELEKVVGKCLVVADTKEDLLDLPQKNLVKLGLREEDIFALRNYGAQKCVKEPSDDVLLSQPFKVLGMEFTFVKLQVIMLSGTSALGDVIEYAKSKIKQAAHLDKNRKVLVVGAFEQLADEVRKRLNAMKQVTDGSVTTRDVNTERLRVYDGKDAYVVIVPCGRGMVRCFAQSFWLAGFANVEEHWSEQTCEENAYKEWSGVGEMQDAVEGAVVVLGAAKTMCERVKLEAGTSKWWIKDHVVEKGNWTAYVLEGKEKKAVFMESKLSYFGDLAKTLGKALYGMGAMEIVHCGVKVGTKVDKEDVMSEVFAPQRFVLMSSTGELTEAGVSNEIGEKLPRSKRATHTSVESPFDEAHGLMREADKKEGIVSIDCEGAFFALAARDCGRRFGALYFASDYVRAMHEQFEGESLGKKPERYQADKDKLLKVCGEKLTDYLHLWKSQVGLAQLRNRLAAHYAAQRVPLFGARSEERIEMQQLYVSAKMHFEKENPNAEIFDASELWSKASEKGATSVVIEGVAGMGKTVLAFHVAQKQSIDGPWKVVLYVELKTLKGIECSFEGVFKASTKDLDPSGIENVKKELLDDTGQILWIFDGYDEVEEVVEIQELVQKLRDGSFEWVKQCIITSRPERKTRKLGKDCVIVELCEWSESQQLKYCEKFLGKDTEAFKSLKNLLDQQDVARDLAGVPLMCEVFCVLMSAKKLPQHAASSLKVIYDALHEYLMERAQDKGVDVDVNEVMRIAQENIVKGGLIELKGANLTRSGLYRRVEQGKYAMMHQSLLEYYAARSLLQLNENALREKLELMLTMQPNQQVLVVFIGESFFEHSYWMVVYEVAFRKVKVLWKVKELEVMLQKRRSFVAKQVGIFNLVELVMRLGTSAQSTFCEDIFFLVTSLLPFHCEIANLCALHGSTTLVSSAMRFRSSKEVLNSMLEQAACRGHDEVVNFLLDKGADASSISFEGACRDGHVKLVKFLISKRANPQEGVEAATKAGRIRVLEILKDSRANLAPGIQIAAESGDFSMMSGMLSLFKEQEELVVDLEKIWRINCERTSKSILLKHIKLLAEKGADVNRVIAHVAKTIDVVSLAELLTMNGVRPKNIDLKKSEAKAIWAKVREFALEDSRLDTTNVTKFLVSQGLNAERELQKVASGGEKKMVEELVKVANVSLFKVDLSWVARNGHLDMAKALVQSGADASVLDFDGVVVEDIDLEVVKYFVDRGANPSRLDLKASALLGSKTEIVAHLIKKGAPAMSALLGASCNGNFRLMEEICRIDNSYIKLVDFSDICGQSNLDVVEYFVDHGVDVNYVSKTTGLCPLLAAALKSNNSIIKFLESKGAVLDISGSVMFLSRNLGAFRNLKENFSAAGAREALKILERVKPEDFIWTHASTSVLFEDFLAKFNECARGFGLEVADSQRLKLFFCGSSNFAVSRRDFEHISSCVPGGGVGTKEWFLHLRSLLKCDFFWGTLPEAFAGWKRAKKYHFFVRIGQNDGTLCLVRSVPKGLSTKCVEQIVSVEKGGYRVGSGAVCEDLLEALKKSSFGSELRKVRKDGNTLGGSDVFRDFVPAAAVAVVGSSNNNNNNNVTLADFLREASGLKKLDDPVWANLLRGACDFGEAKAVEIVVGKLNDINWGQVAQGLQGFAHLAQSIGSALGPFGLAAGGLVVICIAVKKIIDIHVAILKANRTSQVLGDRLNRFVPSLVALQRSVLESFQKIISRPIEDALKQVLDRVKRLGPCVNLVTDVVGQCEQFIQEWSAMNENVKNAEWFKKILPVLKRASSVKSFTERFVEVQRQLDLAQNELEQVLVIDLTVEHLQNDSGQIKKMLEEALQKLKAPGAALDVQVVQAEVEEAQKQIRKVLLENKDFRKELFKHLDSEFHIVQDLIGLKFDQVNKRLDQVIHLLNKYAPDDDKIVDKIEAIMDWKSDKPVAPALKVAQLIPFGGDKVDELDAKALDVDGVHSSLGAKGVLEYAKKKALARDVVEETGLSLVIVGLWTSTIEDFLKSQKWTQISDRTTAEMHKNEAKLYNCIGPRLLQCQDEEGCKFLLMIVPPGHDIVKCYGQSHRLVIPREYSVRAFYIPALMEPSRFMAFTGLDKLREAVQGATVIIGAVETLRGHFASNTSWWRDHDSTLKKPINKFWGYELLQSKYADGTKVVFLGSRASFWGNISYTLALCLFDLGAKELIHAGVRVGLAIDTEAIRESPVYPKTFYLVTQKGDIEEVSLRNAMERTLKVSDAPHISVGTPLDESKDATRQWKKRIGTMTVDDEGAYMARAAYEKNRLFGALYFVSDYVLAFHEHNVDNQLGQAKDSKVVAKEKELVQSIAQSLWMHVTPRSAVPLQELDVFRDAMKKLQPRGWSRTIRNLTFDKWTTTQSLHFYVEKYEPGSPFTDGEINTVSLKEMLDRPQDGAVFLLNDSGSGKSEYLKRLAWSWATGEQQELAGQYDAVVYVSLLNDFDPVFKGKSGRDQLAALVARRWKLNLFSLSGRKILWLFDEWEEALKKFGPEQDLFRELCKEASSSLGVDYAVIAMRPSSFQEDEFQYRAQVMIGDLSDDQVATMAKLLGLQSLPDTREMKSLCRIPMFLELFCEASEKKLHSMAELLYEGLKSRLKGSFDEAVRATGSGSQSDNLVELGVQFKTSDGQVMWTHDLIRSFFLAVYTLSVSFDKNLSEVEWQIVVELLETTSFKPKQACVAEAYKHLLLLPNSTLEKIRARALFKTKDPKLVTAIDAWLRRLPRQAELCIGMANLWDRVGISKNGKFWIDEARKLGDLSEQLTLTSAWILFHCDELDVALAILQQELPKDENYDASHVRLLNLMGELCQRKDRFEEAEKYLGAARLIVGGSNKAQELEMLKNLAWVIRKRGEKKRSANDLSNTRRCFMEAKEDFRRALVLAETCYGKYHLKYGTLLRHLGSTEMDLAEVTDDSKQHDALLEQAALHYHQATEIKSRVLQREHPEVSTLNLELGKVRRMQGRLDEALALIDQALMSRLRWLGPKDIGYARSLHAKGDVLLDKGDKKGAIECFERAKEIYEAKRKMSLEDGKELIKSINRL